MQRNHIELLVNEPIAGCYYWVLMKADDLDGHPTPVAQAAAPMPSRSLAMMAGIAAMQRRADQRAAPAPDALH